MVVEVHHLVIDVVAMVVVVAVVAVVVVDLESPAILNIEVGLGLKELDGVLLCSNIAHLWLFMLCSSI